MKSISWRRTHVISCHSKMPLGKHGCGCMALVFRGRTNGKVCRTRFQVVEIPQLNLSSIYHDKSLIGWGRRRIAVDIREISKYLWIWHTHTQWCLPRWTLETDQNTPICIVLVLVFLPDRYHATIRTCLELIKSWIIIIHHYGSPDKKGLIAAPICILLFILHPLLSRFRCPQ